MKNYLSFGGGVNSVALYLLMEELGMEFEAVFINHGGDWPETYEYVDYFIATDRPVTILKPTLNTIEGDTHHDIISYCKHRNITPSRGRRWCTDRAKIVPMEKYMQTPCWQFIGYAADEAHRAVMGSKKGIEYRWPLIEEGITRQGCIDMIRDAGLDVPRKSGCYICPFQPIREFKELRRKHPELFCVVQKLEETQNQRVTKEGKKWQPFYLCGVPLGKIDKQGVLPGIKDMEYPPCQCGL